MIFNSFEILELKMFTQTNDEAMIDYLPCIASVTFAMYYSSI